MKTAFIFLASLAVILGIFAYVAVFGNPSGTYTVTAMDQQATNPYNTSSTATSTLSNASTTASSSFQVYASTFSPPAISWIAGQSDISLTGASLNGNQLTLTLVVTMGADPECVPLNLRLVADEEGDLAPPNPASFSFPGSGNCNGAPGVSYANQTTTFIVNPTAFPLLFNAEDPSKTFFEIATTTSGGLQVELPGNSD